MTNHNISNHYESHTSTSYESAFFYSEKEYTTWLCNLVRDALGISSVVTDDKLVVDGGTTRCGCNSDKHYSDDSALATADDSGRERKKRVLLDVGGGTGNFTSMVIGGVDTMEGIVVDPFLPASSSTASTFCNNNQGEKQRLKFVKASAEEFIPSGHKLHTLNKDEKKEDDVIPWWKTGYNHVLLKEVVHHFDANERVGIFTGIRNGLIKNNKHGMDEDGSSTRMNEGASILIITRPRIDIDYPMWSAAKDVWATNQPSANDIVSDLRKAGFQDVQQCIKSYPCEVELNRWVDMVRNRFWSTFSHFTDEEIEEGCERIMKEVQQPDGQEVMIQFEERLVFITARN